MDDNIDTNVSTFAAEMKEIAFILRNVDRRSLLVLAADLRDVPSNTLPGSSSMSWVGALVRETAWPLLWQ